MEKIVAPGEIQQATNSMKKLQAAVHQLAKIKGFWQDRNTLLGMGAEADIVDKYMVATKIALIHSELSEGLEGHRTEIPEGAKGYIGEELADAVIRILDLAEFLKIDLGQEILKKHEYNTGREFLHGGKGY